MEQIEIQNTGLDETPTLQDFYKWAKDIGHYHAFEAVERFIASNTKHEVDPQ